MISSLATCPVSAQPLRRNLSQDRASLEGYLRGDQRDDLHPSYGGTLVWGVANKPTVINPILTQTSISANLMALIFDSLVRIDSEGSVIPGLAEFWEVSDDGLEYVFHLRSGVMFHDGKEFTAEDVKFTYDLISDPENNSPWRASTQLIERWSVVDGRTIKMVLREPFLSILHKLVREILPKHIWEAESLRDSAWNYSPVGTGPFRFESWNRQTDEIRLISNPAYFGGRPYLNSIVVKIYPNNTQLWSAIMRHEVDLAQYISYENYKVLERDQEFKTYLIDWGLYCAVAYDLNDPAFSDLQVRKAIAKAIDVPEVIAQTYGTGTKSLGPFHPDYAGFSHNIKPVAYNPSRARMDLMHRGWQDRDGDAILERYGKKIEMRLLVDGRDDMLRKVASILHQQLAEVGVKLIVKLYTQESELVERYSNGSEVNAWLRFFSASWYDGYEAARDWYSRSSEFGRVWSYKNEKIDKLFELARSTADEEVRVSLHQKIHETIYDDQPATFLFYPSTLFVLSERFCNAEAYFTRHMPTYVIKNWYVCEE